MLKSITNYTAAGFVILLQIRMVSDKDKVDPKVSDILKLLGGGTVLAASLIMPGAAAIALREFKKYKQEKDTKEWKKFNLWRLKQIIKRLEKQKTIEIKDGLVAITEKGKRKLLQFNLNDMKLERKTDGKWRLIIYDISEFRKKERNFFREVLKNMRFLKLQQSIYLTPFVCEDEIEYLKQMFGVGEEVQVLKVTGIDNEQIYKEYFGI
ncbi:MAG TPA: hypothetical protein VNA13_01655 [Xanthomonadales bacterium]|nr:hypothetical protein [Xanthomonadales bacterium]